MRFVNKRSLRMQWQVFLDAWVGRAIFFRLGLNKNHFFVRGYPRGCGLHALALIST